MKQEALKRKNRLAGRSSQETTVTDEYYTFFSSHARSSLRHLSKN